MPKLPSKLSKTLQKVGKHNPRRNTATPPRKKKKASSRQGIISPPANATAEATIQELASIRLGFTVLYQRLLDLETKLIVATADDSVPF